MKKEEIIHQGKVERIEKTKVFVRIEQKTACSECHAASVCFASDKKDKIIEVNDYSGNFTLEEEVRVSIRSSMGLFAVIISYAIPLLVVVITVIAGIVIGKNELTGGLAGLLALFVYYLVLYLVRDKIKENLLFSLSKISD
jgi:sigma-E factor negative regulatory protein RseC